MKIKQEQKAIHTLGEGREKGDTTFYEVLEVDLPFFYDMSCVAETRLIENTTYNNKSIKIKLEEEDVVFIERLQNLSKQTLKEGDKRPQTTVLKDAKSAYVKIPFRNDKAYYLHTGKEISQVAAGDKLGLVVSFGVYESDTRYGLYMTLHELHVQ